jgi:hypothetical protein
MNMIRVELASEFRSEDVVLVAMDGPGVTTFLAVLNDAKSHGSSQLEHDGVTHRFVIQAGAADIELGANVVAWRLDHAKAIALIEGLSVLSSGHGQGHYYVDISTPANTLVLSRDEYIRG